MSNVELYKLRAFVLTWHLICVAQYYYAIYFDYHLIVPDNIELPKMIKSGGFGGRSKFLTYWCLIIQAVYFTICLINDVIGTNEVSPKMKMPLCRKLKDYCLATFAFPVALNVGVTFWALMAIDRELVFPKAFDAFFPGWLNHVMHTNIVIFMALEMCTSFRQYPSRKNGLLGLGLFMASYLVWLHVIKHFGGVWVYPVLDVLNFPQRLVFFAVSLLFSVGLYLFGEFFNSIIWNKELKQLKMGSKKVK